MTKRSNVSKWSSIETSTIHLVNIKHNCWLKFEADNQNPSVSEYVSKIELFQKWFT